MLMLNMQCRYFSICFYGKMYLQKSRHKFGFKAITFTEA